MTSRYEHKNINFFGYDAKATVQGAHEGTRTLNDWNRHVKAGEQCIYYINDVKLSELRARTTTVNGKEKIEYELFKDVQELKEFFKTHLFNQLRELKKRTATNQDKPRKVLTKEERAARKIRKEKIRAKREKEADLAAEQACLHWHQAGIQHATYQNAYQNVLVKYPNIGLSDPTTPPTSSKIGFNSVQGGVKIIEENIFRKWDEIRPDRTVKKHEISAKDDYYAKTKTTYIFTPEVVQVKEVVIDCPNRDLAPIFDKRPSIEQAPRTKGNQFLRSLCRWVTSISTKSPQSSVKDIPEVAPEESTQTTYKLK